MHRSMNTLMVTWLVPQLFSCHLYVRIQSKEAEAELLKADKAAAEAFEVASSMGVIMYDIPNCTRKPSVETSTINGGKSTTHSHRIV